MPNQFMIQQSQNIKNSIQLFEQGCVMSATKDDGKISRHEEKAIKRIKSANERYIKDLDKAIKNL